ncbi:hypothetical protein HED34_03205 [Vagococcus fluvialis]|uniref:hypothetical protein n=1 Tax=Vagococcus fluvialis TaxID=2738 RepID=UPI00143313AE|nr:hypothetical protein [Vagococcus fluvialis]NKC58968.1 hypothetical protein [Vagococcus fluvialis]NKD49723.1 hypothetical protein [Vagococcus fluvialis]
MKVKIIEGEISLNTFQIQRGTRRLDERVNEFLASNPNIDIVTIKQSSASSGDADDLGSTTTISIFYNEAKGDNTNV